LKLSRLSADMEQFAFLRCTAEILKFLSHCEQLKFDNSTVTLILHP